MSPTPSPSPPTQDLQDLRQESKALTSAIGSLLAAAESLRLSPTSPAALKWYEKCVSAFATREQSMLQLIAARNPGAVKDPFAVPHPERVDLPRHLAAYVIEGRDRDYSTPIPDALPDVPEPVDDLGDVEPVFVPPDLSEFPDDAFPGLR